jgi:hypothetical protein
MNHGEMGPDSSAAEEFPYGLNPIRRYGNTPSRSFRLDSQAFQEIQMIVNGVSIFDIGFNKSVKGHAAAC